MKLDYMVSIYSVGPEPKSYTDINQGKQVFYQGSRQMTNLSRRYYERELGAGLGPSPSMKEHFGYSEPLRRFIQRESFEPQANEIPNNMPSWLPGDDYMTNFKVGDPYVRIDDGYARLPGAGYEALHPELQGVNPEDYPDIHKLRILCDVAPYSREYNLFRQRIATQARNNTGLQIELDKIVDRVRQVKESSITTDRRRFTAPVDEIEGTVAQASPQGITLKEYQVSSSCRTNKPRARARQRQPGHN
jgi:hypothetical protein